MKRLFRLPAVENRREVEVDGIGNVVFEKSPKAGKINISVKAGRGVRVAIPRRISFRKALEFFTLNLDWVKKSIGKIEVSESSKVKITEDLCNEKVEAAKALINSRVQELSQKHGFAFNRLTIRSQKTRWGSCSAKNNLSLNIRIASLPEELRDYVILHELVHTDIKNHSADFWDRLDQYTDGKSKEYRKRLGGYTIG